MEYKRKRKDGRAGPRTAPLTRRYHLSFFDPTRTAARAQTTPPLTITQQICRAELVAQKGHGRSSARPIKKGKGSVRTITKDNRGLTIITFRTGAKGVRVEGGPTAERKIISGRHSQRILDGPLQRQSRSLVLILAQFGAS